MNFKRWFSAVGAASLLALSGSAALASSHSDAPLIKLDPNANLTDVYAFIRTRPGGERVLVMEISVRPFSEPGDGGLYDAFSDDARYSIHVTNPATGAELQRYDFRFSPVGTSGNYKNLDTILRYGRGANVGGMPDAGGIQDVGDNRHNFVQTYTVTRVAGGVSTVLNGSSPLLVPPYNTGKRATPLYNDPMTGKAISGATTRAGLDKYTFQTTYDLPGGQTVFCGSREDGFYADTPGIFDLLDARILDNDGMLFETDSLGRPTLGQDGRGVDGFKGFNVMHYSIVVPLSQLPQGLSYNGLAVTAAGPAFLPQTGVGVYASVSRPRITLRSSTRENTSSGPFIQVNRLANPLFNEVLVALRDKDNYNRDSPTSDVAKYSTYARNPEVAALINFVFFGDPAAPLVTTGRADLVGIYIPDVIRVNTNTPSVNVAGDSAFSRLSFVGGEVLSDGTAGRSIPGGWPNGRRFGDDVVDIALTAVASGPTYAVITVVGDNADTNDQVYNRTFPYAATPHAGSRNTKDSGINVEMPPPPPAPIKRR